MAIAHRGGYSAFEENTLESFVFADKIGFKNLELDVRTSKDGTLFVCHDDNLKRLIGENLFLSCMTDKDICSLSLRGGCLIPKLVDVLEELPQSNFNIDAKSWSAIKPLCDILNSFSNKSQFCIGGFSDKRIKMILQQLDKEICFSLGPNMVRVFYLSKIFRLPMNFAAGCIQIPENFKGISIISKKLVEYAHRLDLAVHVWTVNDEQRMVELIEMGVDGIITDECFLLKKVLKDANMWD